QGRRATMPPQAERGAESREFGLAADLPEIEQPVGWLRRDGEPMGALEQRARTTRGGFGQGAHTRRRRVPLVRVELLAEALERRTGRGPFLFERGQAGAG